MNRFSRSGGKSIALANELVYKQGVHLIEIVSGIDTTTRKGQNELNKRLLAAEEENLNKLEVTLPGLRSFLRAGNWLGVAPIGYDHYGTRVNDFSKKSITQNIRLNQTGKILKGAWQWKIEGESDSEIIKRLAKYGVIIQKSRMSRMWRNVFYCGLISHKLLDGDVIEGNHEPMVSRETFLKVQDIINLQVQGYTVTRNVPERPLNDSLFCHVCGAKLTGYKATGKTTHYYKCNKCKGVSINAETSVRMKSRTGAHELFLELLDSYTLDEKYIDLFKYQMGNLVDSTIQANKGEESALKQQLTTLKNKREKLEERYAFGDIEHETYCKFAGKLDEQINEIESKLITPEKDISNLKSNLNKAVDFTQNVSKYWASGNLDQRQRIQKLVFPEGLVIDTEKRQYRTSKVNALFSVKRVFIRDTEGDEKEKPTEIGGLSSLVAGVDEISI